MPSSRTPAWAGSMHACARMRLDFPCGIALCTHQLLATQYCARRPCCSSGTSSGPRWCAACQSSGWAAPTRWVRHAFRRAACRLEPRGGLVPHNLHAYVKIEISCKLTFKCNFFWLGLQELAGMPAISWEHCGTALNRLVAIWNLNLAPELAPCATIRAPTIPPIPCHYVLRDNFLTVNCKAESIIVLFRVCCHGRLATRSSGGVGVRYRNIGQRASLCCTTALHPTPEPITPRCRWC
jgi:hypothetical protein